MRGVQHALIEYARNVLGWQDAEHEETNASASRLIIQQMECALVEKTRTIYLNPNTKISAAYGTEIAEEIYRCRFSLNPEFESVFSARKDFRIGARDESGEVRALELWGEHPFFVATLFQPERAAFRGEPSPLIIAFSEAAQLYHAAKFSRLQKV